MKNRRANPHGYSHMVQSDLVNAATLLGILACLVSAGYVIGLLGGWWE
jgi:hypothetical protein